MRAMNLSLLAVTLTLAGAQVLAADADTTFSKTNPNLLYTTKDFYIEIPADCYGDVVCIKDFFLIMTFNVGIDGNNSIKQAGFKDADLECQAKPATGTVYKLHNFTNYTSTITDNGYGVIVEFIPDKINGVAPAMQKFVFTGKMQGSSLKGMLSFHTAKGVTQVSLN